METVLTFISSCLWSLLSLWIPTMSKCFDHWIVYSCMDCDILDTGLGSFVHFLSLSSSLWMYPCAALYSTYCHVKMKSSNIVPLGQYTTFILMSLPWVFNISISDCYLVKRSLSLVSATRLFVSDLSVTFCFKSKQWRCT